MRETEENESEKEYFYDARNRLRAIESGGKRKEYEYDEAGNLRRDEKGKYDYDAFHRMTKAELFTGEVQVNRYDAEGLRYEVEENGRLVEYLYRGEEVVAERNEKEEKRYIRGIELLASDAKEASTYYHYSSDELGSIRYISKGEEIANAYDYDAWGNLEKKEERVENRFYYAGEQRDALTEQYYLRARYYNPVIGRFTQEDTYHGDRLNLYSYCRNNPIMYIDQNGNICEAAAERIRRKGDSATASEREALASYDRHRERLERQLNGVITVTPEGEAWLPGRNTRNDDVIRVSQNGGAFPEGYAYPERTEKAQRECQRVVDAINAFYGFDTEIIELQEEARRRQKNPHKNFSPAVCVFTHEDGTVSVGISGGSRGTKLTNTLARKLQSALNESAGYEKYKVFSKVDKPLLPQINMPKDENNKPIGNKPGGCAEPKAASAAHHNESPIDGMDTRWFDGTGNGNKHPYKNSLSQMEACETCQYKEGVYMRYANANKK